MKNTIKTFNGVKFNLSKAKDIIELSKAVKSQFDRGHDSIAAAVPFAMEMCTEKGDYNRDPLNALYNALAIKSGESVYQKNLRGFVGHWLSGVKFKENDGFVFTGKGKKAAEGRTLADGFELTLDYRLFAKASEEKAGPAPVTAAQIAKFGTRIAAAFTALEGDESETASGYRDDLINAVLELAAKHVPAERLAARAEALQNVGKSYAGIVGYLPAPALTATERAAAIARDDADAEDAEVI